MTVSRALRVAPAAARLLPAAHLAQLDQDADNDDNVCVACGALIEGPAAELVVLHDARMILARLAHPGCVTSGAYEWEGTTAAVQALTLRPDGVDVATLLAWRGAPRPRALLLLEPRIQVALEETNEDWLQRLIAAPLGLQPAGDPIAALAPGPAAGELSATDEGLQLVGGELRVTVPASSAERASWLEHADGGRAVVIVGRGLGIAGPEDQLLATLDAALRSRPVWAGVVTVASPSRRVS